MTNDRIGIIGTGNMRGAMAVRLLESGVSLIVCDRNPEVVAPLRERGALVADSPRAVADTA